MMTTVPPRAPQPTAHERASLDNGRRVYSLGGVLRDAGYVFPGFFIAIASWAALLALSIITGATLILWVGLLLLPITIIVASSFAQLSRRRLRAWGAELAEPRYLERGAGLLGWIRLARDPRRWLDLVFELLIAFPLRMTTFLIALVWTSIALAGITWWVWARFLERDEQVFPANLIDWATAGSLPPGAAHSFVAESICYAVFGLIALATLPPVLRGLALLDGATTRAALAPVERSAPSTGSTFEIRTLESPTFDGWAWIAVSFIAVIAVASGWPLLAAYHQVPVIEAMLIVLLQTAGLLLTVRFPKLAMPLLTVAPLWAALATLSAPVPSTPWPWPVTLLIVQAVAVFVVALRHPWQLALGTWAFPQIVIVACVLLLGLTRAGTPTASVIVSAAVSLGVGLLGGLLRAFVVDRSQLRDERIANAELDAMQRELAERNRVARELHDVVAHSMSVVSIQANTAKYRLGGLSPEAEAEFASIAESSRQALGEMRGLLATLRAGDSETQLAPQPSLSDFPALIEASRQSGAAIEFAATGDLSTVPPALGLTAYRVAQEALSNALRHAPGAPISVALAVTESDVTVTVENAAPQGTPTAAPGSGLGLAGVRERVTALGGTVEAGSAETGGFAVSARLPR